MRILACAAFGILSLLLSANSANAAGKPRKAKVTQNYPAVVWACSTTLSGGRVTTLKGRFTKSQLPTPTPNPAIKNVRVAGVSIEADEFGLLSRFGFIATNTSFQDPSEINYDISSKDKTDVGLITMKFELSLPTKTGYVVIYVWDNAPNRVDGVGLCTVQTDLEAAK
jgi:hypothetical protein